VRRVLVRATTGLGVLLGAATLGFLALYVLPGDPVYAVVGSPDEVSLSAEQVAAIRAQYGFDQPLIVQYGTYLGRLLTGDLGDSYQRGVPVVQVIGEQLGPTLQLAGAAAVVTLLLTFAVALLTAKRRVGRRISSAVEIFFIAAPGFWIGIVLLTIFSFTLGWLPSMGSQGWPSLVLPSLMIALGSAPVLIQVLRGSLEDALDEPFIVTARTRGIGETAVRMRHALRHALIPLTTLSGFLVGGLLGGTVIAETLFTRQGVGRILVTAVSANDVPLVLGLVLLAAAAYVIVNFLVDLAYPLIDPRLRGQVSI
jgi:peptide/nickel transport system permease protein